MNKIWNVKKYDSAEVDKYINKLNISEVLAKLLISRNISVDQADDFINLTLDGLYDPFLMKGMEILVNRILEVKDKNEKVCIYGDYDVDGVTSVTVLYSFLKEIGIDVEYYLPDRMEEGYGLNKDALRRLKNEGVALVITVDCGISACDEVSFANELGLDICITDHHECGVVLPAAYVIVNPKQQDCTYPFKMLAGVGVAFKVITAICQKLNMQSEKYLKYLDIVALGTIADIVPLVDENRIIAKYGIDDIKTIFCKTNPREGLKAIIKVAGIKNIDSSSVSFGIAPRINASGRMADASIAVKMLLAETEVEAMGYAKILNEQNKERQAVEKKILEEAMNVIEKNKMYDKKSIVIYGENWHQGVIGIVASKIAEKYLKPVILLTSDDNDIAKGSGRTPAGISLYEALNECKNLLIQFGGHELAAGVTIKKENIDSFIDKFENTINVLQKKEFESVIDIDLEITGKNDLKQVIEDINKMLPFGQKNPEPNVIYRGIKVVELSTLKDGKHLKLKLRDENFTLDAIGFSQGNRRDELIIGDAVDVVGNIGINEFSREKSVQIILRDFKKR